MNRIAMAAASAAFVLMTVTARTPASGQTGGQPAASSAQAAKPAAGARTLTIKTPEAAQRFVRFLASPDAKLPAPLPKGFADKDTTVTFDPAALGGSPKVAIDDVKTGNTAILPIPAGDTLDVRRADFDHVHQVNVVVSYENNAVLVARVTLTDANRVATTKTIDQTAKGVASFTDVPAGKAKINTQYGDNFVDTRDVDILTDHPGVVLVVPVAVSNKAATGDPISAAASNSAAPPAAAPAAAPGAATPPGLQAPPAPSSGGGIGGLINTLLGLGVAGAAIYLLYRWAQSGGMAATLKKVGVEVNGPAASSDAGTPWQPNAPQAPVVADPSVCQFCGQRKDAAGNCACSLAAGAGPAVAMGGGAAPSQPRLVGTVGVYSGTIFPLDGNGTGVSVGRDATNGIPLPNDTTVSRRHALVRMENGGYVVSDAGSSNGVYVNGVKIGAPQTLRPGDEVQIGNTRFRFEQ